MNGNPGLEQLLVAAVTAPGTSSVLAVGINDPQKVTNTGQLDIGFIWRATCLERLSSLVFSYPSITKDSNTFGHLFHGQKGANVIIHNSIIP